MSNNGKSASQVAYELVQEAYNKFQEQNYTAALQLCEAALAIYEGIDDRLGIGYTLTNIGNIYRRQTIEFYKQAISSFENSNTQISELIKQSLNSSLESQVVWYPLDIGNATIPTPVPPDSPGLFNLYRRTRSVFEGGGGITDGRRFLRDDAPIPDGGGITNGRRFLRDDAPILGGGGIADGGP